MSWITGFHYSKRNLIEGCLAAVERGVTGQPSERP